MEATMKPGDGLFVRDFFRSPGYKSGWREEVSYCNLVKENRKTIDVHFVYYGIILDRINRIPKNRIISVAKVQATRKPLTAHALVKLPITKRRKILRREAERFNKEFPGYYERGGPGWPG